jgi:hypothetical protein
VDRLSKPTLRPLHYLAQRSTDMFRSSAARGSPSCQPHRDL